MRAEEKAILLEMRKPDPQSEQNNPIHYPRRTENKTESRNQPTETPGQVMSEKKCGTDDPGRTVNMKWQGVSIRKHARRRWSTIGRRSTRYQWTKQMAAVHSQHVRCCDNFRQKTHDLELDGEEAEVHDLHGRPKDKIGLQSWQVDITEFLRQRPFASALCDRHECEEASQT